MWYTGSEGQSAVECCEYNTLKGSHYQITHSEINNTLRKAYLAISYRSSGKFGALGSV